MKKMLAIVGLISGSFMIHGADAERKDAAAQNALIPASQAELKEAASIENITRVLKAGKDGSQTIFTDELDREDADRLFGQANTIVPLLAQNPKAKKFMADFDALIPKIEELGKQLPEFIDAAATVPGAKRFVRDFMAFAALKGQMAGQQAQMMKLLEQ